MEKCIVMEEQKQFRIKYTKLREVIRNPHLSPLDKVIVIDLLLYAGVDGNAFPSENLIGKDLSRSARWVRSSLVKLKQKGLVNWKRKGYSKSNSYTINEELYFLNDNSNKKPTSSDTGILLPSQIGTQLPPNVSQERNHLKSTVEQLFEETSKEVLSERDASSLHRLCEEYSVPLVLEAIKEAGGRNLKFIKVGLISMILSDWKKVGKKPPRPKFVSCGELDCKNGYIFSATERTARKCECRELYEEESHANS